MGGRVLEAFGVSSTAERLYIHLLRDPNARIEDIPGQLGWSGAEVRAALDELSNLALLRTSHADPPILEPVAPDVGLESLLARRQADLLARQQQLDTGRAALAMLVAEYADSRPQGERNMIEEITGLDDVRSRLSSLSANARTEVLSFIPGSVQHPDTLEASKPLDAAALARGVRMCTIYLDSVRNDPASVAYAEWLSGIGGQVRTVPTLPQRMIIVDRTVALIPINPKDSSVGAALLSGAGAVSAMCALFDQVWKDATPLGLPHPLDDQGLDRQEREVLRMLANGDTDEHIARRLGVSTRTVGRVASELMRRLGTRSRFQMGVRATELGWLATAVKGEHSPDALPHWQQDAERSSAASAEA